jgi:hypothetical protein
MVRKKAPKYRVVEAQISTDAENAINKLADEGYRVSVFKTRHYWPQDGEGYTQTIYTALMELPDARKRSQR